MAVLFLSLAGIAEVTAIKNIKLFTLYFVFYLLFCNFATNNILFFCW